MTISPQAVAQQALRLARDAMPTYSSKFSRLDYTQHQLFASLALKTYLETDYGGLTQILVHFSELRHDLALDKVPLYLTVCKAVQRLPKKGSPSFSSSPLPCAPGIAA